MGRYVDEARPLTISTWRGSSWLGGAGTENWIFFRSLGSMAACALLGCRAEPCSAVRSCVGAWCAEEEHCPRTQENPALREGWRAGPRDSPAAPGSASPTQDSRSPRLGCALQGWGAELRLPACAFRGSQLAAPGLTPPASVCSPSAFFLSAPLSLQAAPVGSQAWGPSPSPPSGTGARRSEGGLRGKRPMSIEKRVLQGLEGGCGVRARARGAARGPPAVSPEPGVALLMESNREAKGEGVRAAGAGTLALTASLPPLHPLGTPSAPERRVLREACEVEKRVPTCHAVNGGVLESECERGVRGRTPVSHRGREHMQVNTRGLEC